MDFVDVVILLENAGTVRSVENVSGLPEVVDGDVVCWTGVSSVTVDETTFGNVGKVLVGVCRDGGGLCLVVLQFLGGGVVSSVFGLAGVEDLSF